MRYPQLINYAELEESARRAEDRLFLCATSYGGKCSMDGAHGKGNAHEAYPSHFCPHYPYASWQRDRESYYDANYAYYFNDNLCAIVE